MENPELVPLELFEGESYHVFCSYSSTDYDWTHALIQQLEDRGLRVCDHERDFTAGRPILENMTESIQQSQKVMLVLSAEFLRSRWCLLEANMSMFTDCLQRKPIVPVLLQRDVSVPLHLSHLTYESNSKLLLVYVTVDDCRQELSAQSPDDQSFHEAILKYSCAYARCLSKGDFPTVSNSDHLQGSVCFCQYVSYQLSVVETEGCKSPCCQTFSSAPVSDDAEMLLA